MDEPRALLTIAGTDPSGGAGLPVDLHVFRDLGYHGLSAVTAVIWQNTVGVRGFDPVGPDRLARQLDAVLDDIPVAGVKIGMIASPEHVPPIVEAIDSDIAPAPVVLDPVLAGGTDGTSLETGGLVPRIRDRLLERVTVATPNVPEAEALTGASIDSRADMRRAAEQLVALGAESAVVKGGHLEEGEDEIRDVFADAPTGAVDLEPLPRFDDSVRGTGCQLSSAVACRLADGDALRDAVEAARRYLHRLMRTAARPIGAGRSVVVRTEASPRGEQP